MERKIGEQFDYDGVTLEVVDWKEHCKGCYFFKGCCICEEHDIEVTGECVYDNRIDGKCVKFQKVEGLQKKIEQSIRLLQQVQKAHPDEVIEIAYSGGKDSDVILQLAKDAGIRYEAIYKNTTIDPPGTIRHAQEMGATIIRPKCTFAEVIQEKGSPTRFQRFCCSEIKEYKIRDVAVMGIRRSESSKRAELYKEPTQCRFYGSKKNHVEAVYPILEWTNEDVAAFIADRKIKCAPIYYDADGTFHVERRLGCMCCPLATKKNRIKEFLNNPRMVRFYLRNIRIFRDTHPDAETWTYFSSEYELFAFQVFYLDWPIKKFKSQMFDTDWKKLLEDYFGIEL